MPQIHSTEWLWHLIKFYTYLLTFTYLQTPTSKTILAPYTMCRRASNKWPLSCITFHTLCLWTHPTSSPSLSCLLPFHKRIFRDQWHRSFLWTDQWCQSTVKNKPLTCLASSFLHPSLMQGVLLLLRWLPVASTRLFSHLAVYSTSTLTFSKDKTYQYRLDAWASNCWDGACPSWPRLLITFWQLGSGRSTLDCK